MRGGKAAHDSVIWIDSDVRKMHELEIMYVTTGSLCAYEQYFYCLNDQKGKIVIQGSKTKCGVDS